MRVSTRMTIFTPTLVGMTVGPETKAMVEDAAEEGLKHAKAHAPFKTGEYLDSLEVWSASLVDGKWQAAFGSTSSDWHFVEFGTATNAPYRTLTRAAESIGIGFSPE